ncbi:MAG: hypothetical protein KGQ35_09650 [Burkholderiales bacterium]|nr:hypothetical protein [Burkholderiales bacterium]
MEALNYLLLTATISVPAGMGNSVRIDPSVRLGEYLDAFEYYWSLPDTRIAGIILVENSGHNFAPFHEICARVSRVKKFFPVSTSQNYPADKGKGYGEFFMLDQALVMLRNQGMMGDVRLWKITGRIKILNIIEIIQSAPKEFLLYGDFRRVPFLGKRLGGNEWLELRLIAMTLDGYDIFFRKHYDDGYIMEHVFFDRLYPIYKTGNSGIWPRFRRQPKYIGVSGWSNKSYSSFGYRIKNGLRRMLRLLVPNFWL